FFGYEVGLHGVLDFNQPPRAKFRHRTEGSITRIAFTLDAVDLDGDIRHAVWDFGDGSISREFDPVHDFRRPGRFVVTVTVWDDGGEPATKKAVLKLKSRPPKARFRKKKVKSVPGGVRFFDRSRDRNGVVVAWHWDFGDGDTSTARFPEHVYDMPGRYVVTLTVTDGDGETAQRVKGVRIR
ncbi:MAG: PKD domain-containing protein, partial [Planctomycetota bacterium]